MLSTSVGVLLVGDSASFGLTFETPDMPPDCYTVLELLLRRPELRHIELITGGALVAPGILAMIVALVRANARSVPRGTD